MAKSTPYHDVIFPCCSMVEMGGKIPMDEVPPTWGISVDTKAALASTDHLNQTPVSEESYHKPRPAKRQPTSSRESGGKKNQHIHYFTSSHSPVSAKFSDALGPEFANRHYLFPLVEQLSVPRSLSLRVTDYPPRSTFPHGSWLEAVQFVQ